MKKELMDFLEANDLFRFKLDAASECMVRETLDEFFDKYQPERSKREDLSAQPLDDPYISEGLENDPNPYGKCIRLT
jgi:hypothetical protein